MTAKDIALSELHTLKEIIKDVKDIELKALMKEINAAKRIFVGGAGRSLLSMKSFAMRLMQTGHETYLVGEVCTEHSDWRFINCWFWFRKNRNSVEFGEKGKKSWCTDRCANDAYRFTNCTGSKLCCRNKENTSG